MFNECFYADSDEDDASDEFGRELEATANKDADAIAQR